jgi:hypothetical protein
MAGEVPMAFLCRGLKGNRRKFGFGGINLFKSAFTGCDQLGFELF